MKKGFNITLILVLTLSLSNNVIAQTDAICKSPTANMHILPKVVVNNDALLIAMDSCISMSRKCKFYLDGVEPEIVVRPIFGSKEFSINLCFVITNLEEHNISYLLDLYSETNRFNPVSCRYKDVLFIFCIDNKDVGLLANTDLSDTIIYNEPIHSYNFITHTNDVDKIDSKSTLIINGYVFLHLDDNGKWWLNTLNCVQVEEDQLLIEDERSKIYYIPSDNTEDTPSEFHLIK